MLWELELGGRPLDTPERRADLERRLIEDAGLIADRTVQTEYRRFIRDRLFALGRPTRPRPRTAVALKPAFVRDGPEPPPRPGARALREQLLTMLLHAPWLTEEVAEELAAVEIPEPELDRLRREILQLAALQPGLDARGLQQHLLLSGFAAAADGMFLPSVDTMFLVRCSDPISLRKEWVRLTRALTGGDHCALAEATNGLINDVSSGSWERFLAAREQALQAGLADEDET
jgi:DNA primase